LRVTTKNSSLMIAASPTIAWNTPTRHIMVAANIMPPTAQPEGSGVRRG